MIVYETDIIVRQKNEILLRLIGIFNRIMRKAHQLHYQQRFLPSIAPSSSRKDLPKVFTNDSKENLQGDTPIIQKLKKHTELQCLPRKTSLKNPSKCIEELIDRKLNDLEKVDIPTQPKLSRPWVAKELDINKLTTKTSRISSFANNEKSSPVIRRRSYQTKSPSSIEKLQKTDLLSSQTTKLPRTINNKAGCLPRDKINSCKIAMRRGIFPMNQKKSENIKIAEFFEQQEEALSTIYNKEEEDEDQLFISFESYTKIAL